MSEALAIFRVGGEEFDDEERGVIGEVGKHIGIFTKNVHKEVHRTLTEINKIRGPADMKMEMMGQLQSILISVSTDLLRQEFEAKLDSVQKEVESNIVSTITALMMGMLPAEMREEVKKAMGKKWAEASSLKD